MKWIGKQVIKEDFEASKITAKDRLDFVDLNGNGFIRGESLSESGSTSLIQYTAANHAGIGFHSRIHDDGIDIKLESGDDDGDYFSIQVGENGQTTLTTVDDDGAEATLRIVVDGLFSIGSTGIDIHQNGTITNATWNGTAIASTFIADDAVTFAKASGVTPNVYGSIIKILPSDFMTNEDGGSTKFGIGYVDHDDSTYGMKVPNAATELLAFISIPEGMKATHVDIYDNSHNLAIEVFEIDINSSGLTSKGSGNANTTLDITDVNATATNLLAVRVTTTATSNRVYGGKVTIAAQ